MAITEAKHVDTRDRIMDAAEGLFARGGFNATSLRAITNEANVNLASVNYHFGSKDRLIVEVIKRGIRPINSERLTRLAELTKNKNGSPVPLEKVLDCFYRPAFEYFQDNSKINFLRLLGRLLYETGPFTKAILEEEWMPLFEPYFNALKTALPHLEDDEITWRFHFALGSMIFTVSQYESLEAMSCDNCTIRDDFEPAIQRLIAFTTAGMNNPHALKSNS
ncbi:MAG: TetR/AcrR family transcriptional regulator [Verrucomicrobiota bacterium]